MKLVEIKKNVATILNQEQVNGEYLRHWHKDLLTKLEITELRSTASWQKILNHLEMTDIDETIEIVAPVQQEQLTEVDDKIAALKAAIAAKQQALMVVREQIAQHQDQLDYTIERVKNWEPNPSPCKAMVVYEPVTVDEEPVMIEEEEEFLLFATVLFIVVIAIMYIGFIPMCISALTALIYKYRYNVYNTVKIAYDLWELSQMTINLV